MFRPVDLGRPCAQTCPSARDTFPPNTCGNTCKRTKGRPSGRLHSDAQVSQQEHQNWGISVSEHRVWHSGDGKKALFLSLVCILVLAKVFPSPSWANSRLKQATRVSLRNCQKFEPLFQHSKHYLSYSRIQSTLKRIYYKTLSAFKLSETLGSSYSTLNARNGKCTKTH